MNNRFLTIILLTSSMYIAGCSDDNSSYETPKVAGEDDLPENTGIVSQKNLSIAASEPQPPVYDPDTGIFSEEEVNITVKVGDISNQLLTDSHTIYFATEWGLITPSCITVSGECSVKWQTSSFANIPGDLLTTVTAWTTGEETFSDTNGNKIFDDGDIGSVFIDIEEPYVDANMDGAFNNGDTLIDVVNGNDLTGMNGVHDIGDTFLNSPNCTHSSLCSSVAPTTFIWVDMDLFMLKPEPPPEEPATTTPP